MIPTEALARAGVLEVIGEGGVRGKRTRFERRDVTDDGAETWDVCLADVARWSIGEVRWYVPWNRYAFVPGRCTVYDGQQLREISVFVQLLKRAHEAPRT